jgi:hypothetical protein
MSLHADLDAAKNTISKVRMLENKYNVRTILAHDISWMGDNIDEVLMSLLDEHLKLSTTRTRIMQGDIP